MAFEMASKKTGRRYWLHEKKTGRGTLFFFSKDSNGSIDLPEGMETGENSKTGLPHVKKKEGFAREQEPVIITQEQISDYTSRSDFIDVSNPGYAIPADKIKEGEIGMLLGKRIVVR